MKWDYHVHLERGPYSKEWMYKFLEAARVADIDEIGFSEHAYRFEQTKGIWPSDWGLKAVVDADVYVNLVQELKKAGYPVKLGVEVDFAPGIETALDNFISSYPWDYVIGSVHFIGNWGFDRPDQAYRWKEVNVNEAYKKYFKLFGEAAQSRLFDIMAHPDVVKVFGYRPSYSMIEEYERCAEILAKVDVCFEINTAGLRLPAGEIYPAREFLKALAQAGIPSMISSDAHRPEDVGEGFDLAYNYARKHQIKHLTKFCQRKRTLISDW